MAACTHDLVVRAQGGDAAALDRLLVECRFDARRYALRHCVTSEVDDAVQEALLIVAGRLRSFKTAASFAGWLFTVVRRECQRLSRRMFAHEELDDEKIADQLAARPMDELRTELAFALESLPAHYLGVILLRDFEEPTIAEICERLDVSVQTAKARLRRAGLLVREYPLGAMGEIDAAIVVAAILQRGDEIKSTGGYLRVLTGKAGAGEFSIGPVLMALIRGRKGNIDRRRA